MRVDPQWYRPDCGTWFAMPQGSWLARGVQRQNQHTCSGPLRFSCMRPMHHSPARGAGGRNGAFIAAHGDKAISGAGADGYPALPTAKGDADKMVDFWSFRRRSRSAPRCAEGVAKTAAALTPRNDPSRDRTRSVAALDNSRFPCVLSSPPWKTHSPAETINTGDQSRAR